MHEYGIVQTLLQRVEEESRRRGATAVHRIRLRLGELSGVETELLREAYRVFRQRGVCSAAELDIVSSEASWECARCGRPVAAGGRLWCIDCEAPARLVSGDEIVLERIEMEVA
jgi:hydrogenase nickel incorporation protein HypA/HybF